MDIKQAENEQQKSDAFEVRRIVFVNEQKVPAEIELDEHDQHAYHFVGYKTSEPIAASRLRITDDFGKLERICVKRDYRGQSYGKQLITFMEEFLKKNEVRVSKLNAQTHALSFYENLGYEVISEEFMDAGIAHVAMRKKL